MRQLSFDDMPRARASDPVTSKAAARQATGLAGEHQRIILDVMRCGNDWTADEVAIHCDLDRHQIGWRLGELERAGKVRRSGQTRPTPNGRQAQCYEVVL